MRLAAGGAGLAILALTASAPMAAAPAADAPAPACFRVDQWEGTTAASPRDLYIRVGAHDIWHLGMAEECSGALSQGRVRVDAFIVSGGFICKPSDLELSVAPSGFSTAFPCTVGEMHKLTPDEAAGLPKKWIP